LFEVSWPCRPWKEEGEGRERGEGKEKKEKKEKKQGKQGKQKKEEKEGSLREEPLKECTETARKERRRCKRSSVL